MREIGALKILLPPVAVHLEQLGPEAAERHLRALEALDAHVRVGEVPSDAVLLATLLMPLPRDGAPKGPIPRAGPRPPRPGSEPSPAVDDVEAQPVAADGEPLVAGAAEPDDDELDEELEALSEELEEDDDASSSEDEPGADADPAHAPLPEGALRHDEPHDERLGAAAVPAFPVGPSDVQPWSLPHTVVAPEIVLAEMVRTARLPRRIAERTRMILLAQPVLSGERRKRRSKPQDFARQSIFPEALAVFELSVAATERGMEQLARWQAIFAGQDLSLLEPDVTDAPGPRGDRPRRRRRGGRRGGKGHSA
jgi:hypothetical protein